MDIPECFYRVSVKALILNEARDKFLVLQEENGSWDMPGGGLEWDSNHKDDIAREIAEEMSLEVLEIATNPSYFCTNQKPSKSDPSVTRPFAYVYYETKLKSFDFKPSDECVAIEFVDKDSLPTENVHQQTLQLAELFDPNNH